MARLLLRVVENKLDETSYPTCKRFSTLDCHRSRHFKCSPSADRYDNQHGIKPGGRAGGKPVSFPIVPEETDSSMETADNE